MHRAYHFLITGWTVLALSVIAVPVALAGQSASFQLFDSLPNYGEHYPTQSSNFSMNENGLTWNTFGGTSNSFQLTTSPQGVVPPSSDSGIRYGGDVPQKDSGGRRGAGSQYLAAGSSEEEVAEEEVEVVEEEKKEDTKPLTPEVPEPIQPEPSVKPVVSPPVFVAIPSAHAAADSGAAAEEDDIEEFEVEADVGSGITVTGSGVTMTKTGCVVVIVQESEDDDEDSIMEERIIRRAPVYPTVIVQAPIIYWLAPFFLACIACLSISLAFILFVLRHKNQ